jgi:hypothetical protein
MNMSFYCEVDEAIVREIIGFFHNKVQRNYTIADLNYSLFSSTSYVYVIT